MRKKVLFSLGMLLLFVTMIVSFFAIVKPTPISRTNSDSSVQQAPIKVAIVNEDTGKVYNGQPINIANTLVNSFIAKNNYKVEVVSRSIAESGLKNETYQLMIVLPSKFSEEALAIESTSPVQAKFQYQIQSSDQLTVKQAEQAVVAFKELFNKDLINIYFTSIIGNLKTAQGQVADVVTNEHESLTSFNNKLVDPLAQYGQQFNGLGSSPNNLLSSYSSFNKTLLNTNDAFKSIDSVNKTYEETINGIDKQQKKWDNSLNTREQALSNYDKDFSKLSVEKQLSQLAAINTQFNNNFSEPAIWKETTDKASSYNKDIAKLLESLKKNNKEIDDTLSNYDTKIREAVESSLAKNPSAVDGANKTLGSYIKSLNTSMQNQITSKWPSVYYDDTTINNLSLSDTDKQHLKNISAFIRWYSKKIGKDLPTLQSTTLENEEFSQLKNDIKSKSTTKRELTLPSFEGKISKLKITVPSGYYLKESNFGFSDLGGGSYQVSFPGEVSPGMTISYTLGIKNENDLNVLSPVLVKYQLDTTEDVKVIKEDAPYVEKDKIENETVHAAPVSPATSVASGSSTPDVQKPTEIITITKTITTTKINQTEKKVLNRHYEMQDIISNWEYNPTKLTQAVYKDVEAYLQLSGLVTAYYGLDLSKNTYTDTTFVPAEGSLAALANNDDLKTIVTNLIKATTVEALKSDLKISDKKLTDIQSRLANAEKLTSNIEQLRTTTNDLITQLRQLIEQTKLVDTTIKGKPSFVATEKVDNTSMVNVSMDMNRDLGTLISASKTLMDNTKANQAVSETIQATMTQLTNDVNTLEKDGKSLSARVSELKNIMSSEYGSNEEFLKNFSTVLSNTRTGNTKNDAVYEYLSNPVDASKIGNVVSAATNRPSQTNRQDERSGLLVILISYLVSLVVAYLFQHADKEELQRLISLKDRLSWRNSSGPMFFLSVISVAVGSIIAIVSGVKLAFSVGQLSWFVMLLVLVSLMMTYSLNILLDKLKSLGFLISISLLLLYIISATQLFDEYYVNPAPILTTLSPLTYLEGVVRLFINQQNGVVQSVMVIVVLTIALGLVNIFLYRQVKDSK
ncbi:type VII secretion protein EsaA [Streptococcus mitis]|uniref:Type VII secretion protein EsaA n=2 Tax=Streptococcus mitis group TaxID=3409772 RepID=A0A387AWD2_9STRE|nr:MULTISPECIES: type VII secretion protein EsaA [Streptococcus]AYF95344.1 type VII secretion protein EsaA [Streptococcus gwangjuense]KEQ45600.1 type VII secretion protein EsaA [Streptococcus mitis]